jgi:hypothetical protein
MEGARKIYQGAMAPVSAALDRAALDFGNVENSRKLFWF